MRIRIGPKNALFLKAGRLGKVRLRRTPWRAHAEEMWRFAMVIRRTCFLLLCILAACDSSPTTPESKWGYLRPLTDIDSSESAFSLAAKGLRSSSSSDGYPWNYRCEIKGPDSTGTTFGTSFSNTTGHWRHNGQGWGLDTAYGDPIEITFGQPIYRVAIIATGSRDCFGTTQGSVTAFSAGGAQMVLPRFNGHLG
jgi:hypothetical protein